MVYVYKCHYYFIKFTPLAGGLLTMNVHFLMYTMVFFCLKGWHIHGITSGSMLTQEICENFQRL